MELGMNEIIFFGIIGLVIMQRILELRIAHKNTCALLKNGGIEFGKDHYWILVTLHTAFFVSIFFEVAMKGIEFFHFFYFAGIVFLTAQIGRIWVISSMRGRWTTRIIVLKGEKLVSSGPFLWFAHPNYLIVAIEIATLPLMFNLYFTAINFSILNAFVLLCIRLPVERRALKWVHEI
jgi:methyltransferase